MLYSLQGNAIQSIDVPRIAEGLKVNTSILELRFVKKSRGYCF